MLPLEYNVDLNILKDKIKAFGDRCPKCYNVIAQYFLDVKIKYFKDGSYNYNKFPKDIRSNSIFERYNKIVKSSLGVKRNCNWVVFLNFINNELIRINDPLAKNENKNVLYESKHTKFSLEKYNNDIYKKRKLKKKMNQK